MATGYLVLQKVMLVVIAVGIPPPLRLVALSSTLVMFAATIYRKPNGIVEDCMLLPW